MNRTSYLTCQNLIRHLRKWEIEYGSGWPGKGTNEPAKTLYPNLLAEMGWGFPWLRLPAEFADVSQEIMAAVLEDGEELNFPELLRLSQYAGASIRYLAAPQMSFVDPATNKGKVRRRYLADLLKRAEGLDCWRAEFVLSSLREGKAVTYASYRCAVKELSDAIDRKQRAQHQPRSTRRSTK